MKKSVKPPVKTSVKPPKKSTKPPSRSTIPKSPSVPKFTIAKDSSAAASSICPVCGGEVIQRVNEIQNGTIFISTYEGAHCKKCKILFESMPDPGLFKKLNK